MIKRAGLLMMALVLAGCLSARFAAAQEEHRQRSGASQQSGQARPETQQATSAAASSSPQPQEPAPQDESKNVSTDSADLTITATVTARELRFETVPDAKVEFTGQPRRETEWDAVRENLPRPVQPGVTYRDIGIRLKIVSVFADIDRIVAEALGEVPVQDQLPPQNNSSENSSPQSSAQQPGEQRQSSPPPGSTQPTPLPLQRTSRRAGARP